MSELMHSSVAERALLSGILHDPVTWFDVVREQLPEGGFYFEQHEAAYDVLLNMHEARLLIEPRTFTIRSGDLGKTSLIGEATINEIIAHRPPPLHIQQYLQTCKEKRAMREMLAFSDWVRGQVHEPGNDPATLVELMQVRAMGISLDHNRREPRHISAVLDEIDIDIKEALALADSGRKIRGLETGLVRIDQMLGGIERGDRYLVVGLSNVGKTWRALQMVRCAVEQGERIQIFMRDGKDKEHIIRLYADMAGVELGFLLGGNQKGDERAIRLEKLREAKVKLSQMGIFIDDSADTIQEQNAIVRRMVKKHGITGTMTDFFGRERAVGFKNSDKTAMLANVAEEWASGIDSFKGKLFGIMLAQANQLDFRVGQPLEKGPGSLKDCKTLYDVATKAEGWSEEKRTLEQLKHGDADAKPKLAPELRIPDLDRNGAPALHADEQILLCSIIKSKNTRKGDVWARLQGDIGRLTDLCPGVRLDTPTSSSFARLAKQIEQGGPNYASRFYDGPRGRPRKDGSAPPVEADDEPPEQTAFDPLPPKVAVGGGPSLHGPLSISRPHRPLSITKEDAP
jgi:replicative DNA helicase